MVTRRGRLRSTRTIISLASLPVVLLILPFLSLPADGATTDKTVYGVVYDMSGTPVSGVDVTVEIWGGWWPTWDFLRDSISTVTDAWGEYEVTFSSNYWDPHNTIMVIATWDSLQETERAEADEDPTQIVDVHFSTAILSSPARCYWSRWCHAWSRSWLSSRRPCAGSDSGIMPSALAPHRHSSPGSGAMASEYTLCLG